MTNGALKITPSLELIVLVLTMCALSAAVGANPTTRVWDVITGQPIAPSFMVSTGVVYSAVFSPDGKIIATASGDGTVRVWDATTGGMIARRGPCEHNWTFGWGRARYGFTQFGPVDRWPRSTFLVWNNNSYRIPGTFAWALVLGIAVLLALLIAGALRLSQHRPSVMSQDASSPENRREST